MKYEWRKKDKHLYLPKATPTILNIPPMRYLTITGTGNPNSESFSQCVAALYALSYGIKMSPKKGIIIPGYYEYTVFPLEGKWDLTTEGRKLHDTGISIVKLKDNLEYKVMIRQPDFVDNDMLDMIRETVYKKKKNENILEVVLETIDEGLSCQMLHQGSYDNEPESFAKMEKYCIENGYIRWEQSHKEIYLSDPSKVAPERLKTTIRFKIKST